VQFWVSAVVVFLASLIWLERAWRFKKADDGDVASISGGGDAGGYKPVFAGGAINNFV
jgi:hypothetical protein